MPCNITKNTNTQMSARNGTAAFRLRVNLQPWTEEELTTLSGLRDSREELLWLLVQQSQWGYSPLSRMNCSPMKAWHS